MTGVQTCALPILAGFQLRMSLLSSCFSYSAVLGWAAAIASGFLLFSGMRLMFVFLSPLPASADTAPEPDERVRYEILMRRILLIVLMALLVMIGFFPSLMDIFVSGIRTQYALIFG